MGAAPLLLLCCLLGSLFCSASGTLCSLGPFFLQLFLMGFLDPCVQLCFFSLRTAGAAGLSRSLSFWVLSAIFLRGCLLRLFTASEQANVVAFGIHIPTANLSFQARVPGEDQSAFPAEVEGLHTVLKALHVAACSYLTHLASAL